MKLFHTVLYIGLGLMLLVFGLNKFLWLLKDFDFTGYPEAQHLFSALRYSGEDINGGKGYIMHLVGFTEVLAGVLLILRKWVPFALVVLVPISINIVAFHLMVNLPNIGPALVVALLNTYLIYKNWNSYKSLFS